MASVKPVVSKTRYRVQLIDDADRKAAKELRLLSQTGKVIHPRGKAIAINRLISDRARQIRRRGR